jgi:hypothetical protein
MADDDVGTEDDAGDDGGSAPDWSALISAAIAISPTPVVAMEHVESLGSASAPQKIRCDDGHLYAVKFRTNGYGNGRAIFAEHVVPRLGALVGAPIPEVALVSVTADLLDVSSFLIAGGPPTVGLHHGSRWVNDFADREGIAHVDQNREALAALSVLYTWAHCPADHQLIYSNKEPHAVLSVDHSAFFIDQGAWTPSALLALPAPSAYDGFYDPAGLSDIDRSAALDMLEAVKPEDIAGAVAGPPDEWGVDAGDRAALASFLHTRREQVLTLSGRVGK